MSAKGLIFAISAPSGCGKTTVMNEVISQTKNLKTVISVNSREKRSEETNGVDYIFISDEEFDEWIKKDLFIEFVEIYGTKRGILKSEILKNINNSIDTICAIDWNGVNNLKKEFSDNVISIFLLPPSIEILKQRIINRGQDSEKDIEIRMNAAKKEMENAKNYDYCVINDILTECVDTVKSIICSEKHRTFRFLIK